MYTGDKGNACGYYYMNVMWRNRMLDDSDSNTGLRQVSLYCQIY